MEVNPEMCFSFHRCDGAEDVQIDQLLSIGFDPQTLGFGLPEEPPKRPRPSLPPPASVAYRAPTVLVSQPISAFEELRNHMVLAAMDPDAPRAKRERKPTPKAA